MGCGGLCGVAHTAQRQVTPQIPIGFCFFFFLSWVSVLVSATVSVMNHNRTWIGIECSDGGDGCVVHESFVDWYIILLLLEVRRVLTRPSHLNRHIDRTYKRKVQ